MKELVLFYIEYWVDRCKVMHEEEEQKKRIIQWHGNVFNKMLNGESESRRNVERTRLNVDRASNDSIRSCVPGVLNMKMKLKKHP